MSMSLESWLLKRTPVPPFLWLRRHTKVRSATQALLIPMAWASGRDILSPMNRPLLTITTLVLFSAVAGAQDDAQYKAWMQSLQPTLRAIRGAADNAAAAADATKLRSEERRVGKECRSR